jgi:NAD-reducing hydrogenase small subunit
VRVEYFLPGCPPPAPRIKAIVGKLLAGQEPALTGSDLKFG